MIFSLRNGHGACTVEVVNNKGRSLNAAGSHMFGNLDVFLDGELIGTLSVRISGEGHHRVRNMVFQSVDPDAREVVL